MLDTKDFSLKSLLKEDRATFIGTALCPIITLAGTVLSFSVKSIKSFLGLSIDNCISWLYFLQALFVVVRLAFSAHQIQVLLRSSASTVSMARMRLLKKIFATEGGAEEFDRRLRDWGRQ